MVKRFVMIKRETNLYTVLRAALLEEFGTVVRANDVHRKLATGKGAVLVPTQCVAIFPKCMGFDRRMR